MPVLTAFRRRSSVPVHRFTPAVAAALVAAVCGLVSPPTPADAYPLNRCAPTENGLPVLQAVSVTQNVDVRSAAGRVRIAATAYDTGGPGVRTGLRAVRVHVSNFSFVDLEYVGGHQWVGYLAIPRWAPSGTAVLESVQLTDRADFPYRYYDDEYDPEQSDVTYQPGGERRWSQVKADRTFKVVSNPDATVPQLTGLDFTPRSVDTRQAPAAVTISAQGTDNLSGVSGIEVTFDGPNFGHYRPPATIALAPVAGSPGRFTGRWTVPRNAGTGDWSVISVDVVDRAGNGRSVGVSDIVRAGWPSVLHVVSDPEPAMAEPTVVSVTPSAGQVDVRAADQSVTYRLHVVNPVAPLPPGNATVGLNVGQPERSWVSFSRATLVSGDLHDGMWEVVATVDSCVALPGTLTPTVSPGDGMTAPPVQVLAGDNTTPTLTARMSGNKVVVTFSEDVNGVSRYPLAVLRRNGLDYERVPGTWSCGAGVSCVAGPVRTATYTPTGTGAVWVRANPSGHLEVTDRAGNPAHQTVTITR